MLEINKYLQNKQRVLPNIGDEVEVEYYSKISGIQLRKFNGICIAIKKNKNLNNIVIELLNINKQSNLVFKYYLNWNQLFNMKIIKNNVSNYRKSKLYYLNKK